MGLFDRFKKKSAVPAETKEKTENNILNIKKQEFRKEKIKRIFNDQARKI